MPMRVDIRIKWWFKKRFRAALTYLPFDGCRTRPKIGETIETCNSKLKVVEYVSAVGDDIEYTDGSSDSYWHCGWQRIDRR